MNRISRVCPACGKVYTAVIALVCTCGERTRPVDTRTWGSHDPRVIMKAAT